MKETDLYLPVKALFEDMGYSVLSEVKDMDVTAVKEDELIIIELKTSLNLRLIIQGAKRQRITDRVYVAVPMPPYKKRYGADFKDREYILRRLSIGLILVSNNTGNPYAQIAFDPAPFDRSRSMSRNKSKKKRVRSEINERHGDYNIGGSKGEKLVTAYRERALLIASYLEENEYMSPKQLRQAGTGDKTLSILNKNYYGWFDRIARGMYRLSSKGREEINSYRHIIKQIVNK